MQYDRLFKAEEPGKTDNFAEEINKDSLKVLNNVVVEPSVAMDALRLIAEMRNREGQAENDKLYHSDLTYQFERSGYFALDSSSNTNKLVFNRVVTLRDTWASSKGKPTQAKQKNEQNNSGKKRGGGQASILEDIRRVALRAGTILEAAPHPEADSLIVCKLDVGDKTVSGEPAEPRTVVAGLAGKIPFNKLVASKVVAITNLKPAKMRGVESHAMLLAASDGKEGDGETVQLIEVPDSVPNGELLSFEGKEIGEPDVMLKSKGALKVWDRVKAKLRVNEGGEATYADENGTLRLLTSAGSATASSLTDCIIG